MGAIHDGRALVGERRGCDVVVVGSGAGGAVAAAELAEDGLSVIVVEEGPHRPTESFSGDDMAMVRALYRDGGATTTLGRPPITYNEGRCVGGSTVINGAMAWRTPERVLRRWQRDEEMPGLTPEALDPWFARVERLLSVAPQDPSSIGRDQHLLRQGAQRLGWRVVDNRRAQVHCAGCNRCLFGCPTGAKQSTLVSYLPRAMAFGAEVYAGCRVDRVRFRGKRAVGVEGTVVPEGGGPAAPFTVDASAVVVACGAIHTPALLVRSGVRSPSGRIGRGLWVHPGAQVTAVFSEPVEGWKGVHQAYQVREFEDDGVIMAAVNLPPALVARSLALDGAALGRAMEDYPRMVTAGVLVEDSSSGRVRVVRGRPVPTYDVTAADAARIARAVRLQAEALFAAGAVRVHLPFGPGDRVVTGMDELRGLPDPRPRDLDLLTVHLMGTAAMGGDPGRHVCDPDGRVRDTVGLSVLDASLFPSPVGTNPMETIMALSGRGAAALAEDLGRAR
ncbi:MAG TPA: GMC family oxidoreductase [Acidimicrobiales bacterium]|nr:GMC family oxidoreductase [Acidimicrobiales bacterium]